MGGGAAWASQSPFPTPTLPPLGEALSSSVGSAGAPTLGSEKGSESFLTPSACVLSSPAGLSPRA